ncbi:hypothetical protein [Streptomyces dangxiongensis]|uniref:hypothetical protein n=1 Tax=Streptomyces dangxiongensis TaxID=1442032 RepID=UPI0013CE72FC|nr:hypothetical protein [Streptomyces dangxiongensis]
MDTHGPPLAPPCTTLSSRRLPHEELPAASAPVCSTGEETTRALLAACPDPGRA